MFNDILNYIKDRLGEPTTWKGMLMIGASVLMYFTPDHIDRIIIALLGVLGITDFLTVEKRDE